LPAGLQHILPQWQPQRWMLHLHHLEHNLRSTSWLSRPVLSALAIRPRVAPAAVQVLFCKGVWLDLWWYLNVSEKT
jgi:hypothetical protein